MLFLLFLIQFRCTFCEMSNRVLVLFLKFIEPADRFHGFLAGTFFRFIVISIHNRKADAAMGVGGFFKIHNKYSVSYNTYCTTKRYKTLVKYDKFLKNKKACKPPNKRLSSYKRTYVAAKLWCQF